MPEEIYLSTVIETTGPVPGPYSMIGLATLAMDEEGKDVGVFEAGIRELPSAGAWHPSNERYWKHRRNERIRLQLERNAQDPIDAISAYVAWVRSLKGPNRVPVLTAWHSSQVYQWVNWYAVTYTTGSPLGFGAIDIKSQAQVFLGENFTNITKDDIPESWRKNDGPPLSVLHKAKKQAHIFGKLLEARKLVQNELGLSKWLRECHGIPFRDSQAANQGSHQI